MMGYRFEDIHSLPTIPTLTQLPNVRHSLPMVFLHEMLSLASSGSPTAAPSSRGLQGGQGLRRLGGVDGVAAVDSCPAPGRPPAPGNRLTRKSFRLGMEDRAGVLSLQIGTQESAPAMPPYRGDLLLAEIAGILNFRGSRPQSRW